MNRGQLEGYDPVGRGGFRVRQLTAGPPVAVTLPDKGVKTCRRCQQARPVRDFRRDTRYADGLFPWCRPCDSAYGRARRKG